MGILEGSGVLTTLHTILTVPIAKADAQANAVKVLKKNTPINVRTCPASNRRQVMNDVEVLLGMC